MWAVDPGKKPDSEIFHCGDGFSYYKNRTSYDEEGAPTKIYLRCVKGRSDGCPGTAHIDIDARQQLWSNGTAHICHGDASASGVRHMRYEILVASQEHPFLEPKDVFESVAFTYPNNIADKLSQVNLKPAMSRARQFPNVPDTLAALDVLLHQRPELVATLDDQDSLYAATVGPPGHQSTIFMSRRSMNFLRFCSEGFGDATFTPTPVLPNGSQVYVLSTMKLHNVIPLLIAIMESKHFLAYDAVVEYVQVTCPRFRPRRIRIDFERQQMMAWSRRYPHACIKGCYIHFVRAVSKKAAALGLKQLANRVPRLKSLLRAFTAIALLPERLLDTGFQVLVREAIMRGFFDLLLPFIYYFMRTWLRGWRRATVSVFREKDRTNNASESANRMLRRRTGPHHPSLWKFLNGWRKMEHAAYLDMRKWRRRVRFGANRTAKTLLNDACIKNFTRELLQGNLSVKRFLFRASNRAYNVFNMHM